MAEGVFGRFLGGEAEDGPELDSPLPSLDPMAAAAAMNAAKNDTGLAEMAAAYFARQTSLVDKQEHLVDIQAAHLQERLANLKLRRHSERLKVALQLFVALIAVAIGAGFLTMIYRACQSRSVVVEVFDVSPALTSRGSTGRLLAGSSSTR